MPKTVGESPNSVSKMEIKRDASPRKSWTKSHTVHNEDKLKV